LKQSLKIAVGNTEHVPNNNSGVSPQDAACCSLASELTVIRQAGPSGPAWQARGNDGHFFLVSRAIAIAGLPLQWQAVREIHIDDSGTEKD
jgi:hypothetical protein